MSGRNTFSPSNLDGQFESRVLEPIPVGSRIIVVGAGAFGGWAALMLQRRGLRVTLIDQSGPGNSRSSSGGETRTGEGAHLIALC